MLFSDYQNPEDACFSQRILKLKSPFGILRVLLLLPVSLLFQPCCCEKYMRFINVYLSMCLLHPLLPVNVCINISVLAALQQVDDCLLCQQDIFLQAENAAGLAVHLNVCMGEDFNGFLCFAFASD